MRGLQADELVEEAFLGDRAKNEQVNIIIHGDYIL